MERERGSRQLCSARSVLCTHSTAAGGSMGVRGPGGSMQLHCK